MRPLLMIPLVSSFFIYQIAIAESAKIPLKIINEYAIHSRLDTIPFSKDIQQQHILVKDGNTKNIAIKQSVSSHSTEPITEYITEVYNPFGERMLHNTDQINMLTKTIHRTHDRKNEPDHNADYICNFKVDELQNITEIDCPYEKELISYQNGKVISAKNSGSNSIERTFDWDGDRISQIKANRKNSKYSDTNVTISFTYNDKGQITESTVTIQNIFKSIPKEDKFSFTTKMVEFNEYGDWIRAEVITDRHEKGEIIREITYQ